MTIALEIYTDSHNSNPTDKLKIYASMTHIYLQIGDRLIAVDAGELKSTVNVLTKHIGE